MRQLLKSKPSSGEEIWRSYGERRRGWIEVIWGAHVGAFHSASSTCNRVMETLEDAAFVRPRHLRASLHPRPLNGCHIGFLVHLRIHKLASNEEGGKQYLGTPSPLMLPCDPDNSTELPDLSDFLELESYRCDTFYRTDSFRRFPFFHVIPCAMCSTRFV